MPNERKPLVSQETIAAAQQKDADALSVVIDTHYPLVCAVLTRIIGDKIIKGTAVEDLTQDTFETVLQKIDQARFPKPHKITSWILSIATNKAIDRIRSSVRFPEESLFKSVQSDEDEESDLCLYDPTVPTSEQPENILIDKETNQRFVESLKEVNVANRGCILLLRAIGYEYHEIADTLKIPLGTVRSSVSRGTKNLRRTGLYPYLKDSA